MYLKFFILALSGLILLSSVSAAEAAKKVTPTPQKIKTEQKTKSVQKTKTVQKKAQPKTSIKQKQTTSKKSTTIKKSAPVKKQTPQKNKTKQKSTKSKQPSTKKSTSSDISVSYKVNGSSLAVTFGNLKNATSVSYALMYATNGQQEGAVGTINPKGANTATRSLLFGTCSKNVCRYHSNISDVVLEVTANLKSGKTFSQTYPIGL